MRPAHRPTPRPPYWTVVAFVGLMLVPSPWLPFALGALLGIAAAWQVRRALAARRRARARPRRAGAVALGRERGGPPVVLEAPQLAAHGLILGASGSGKSTTLLRLMTERVAQHLPVVALDLKGSPAFAHTLADAAARAGRPFALWTADGPCYWNPLAHGNPTELKDRLISTERFTEPHYQRAAERFLQSALTVLEALNHGAAPTLAQVVAVIEPRSLTAAARRAGDPLSSQVQDYVARLTGDQLSAVRGLATRLAIITESHTGAYLGPPPNPRASSAAMTVDLRSALRGDAVVLFSLNSSTYGKLAAQIGTIVVQDLVSAAGARLGEELTHEIPPALVAIDEFSALGAEHLLALFARGRAAGVSVVVATQELADLDRAGRGMRDQILGNTAVKVIHRQDVPSSAHVAAQLAGTHWVWEETRQFGGRASVWEALTPRGTRREVERFVVHPNEIRSLSTGSALLITKVPVASARLIEVAPSSVATPPSAAPARPDVVRSIQSMPAEPHPAPERAGQRLGQQSLEARRPAGPEAPRSAGREIPRRRGDLPQPPGSRAPRPPRRDGPDHLLG